MRPCRFIPLFAVVACSTPQEHVALPGPATSEIRDDLRFLYDSLGLSGSFILYDEGRDHWILIDSSEASVTSLPASTYKILGTLIALETGVAADADAVLPWDSIRRRPEVDRDLSLRDAYRHSAYWFHRDVARHIGADRLKQLWDTVGYGNADTSGGFDRAWVAGNLRITPQQQIDFLQRLQREELPFSQRTMRITQEIMVEKDTLGHVLRAKTGWAQMDSLDLGWYVGWVERADSTGPFFFANRIRCSDSTNPNFAKARRSIAIDLLERFSVLPN